MAVARPILAFLALMLTAGACLLIIFVVLAGAVNSSPVNMVYFLQADTSGIPGAMAQSRWTLWNICGAGANGLNTNCGPVKPAYPFDPQSNFNSTTNVPASFIGTNEFYYLTRFLFAFILISLFFSVCSLFLGIFALCTRIGAFISSAIASIALFFQTLTAALMTAAYVIGRNNFDANNMPAQVGNYAFGFIWAAWVCLLLCSMFFCVGGFTSRRESHVSRKRSTRSRGSFVNGDDSSFVRSA